jgi:hypothetical protein
VVRDAMRPDSYDADSKPSASCGCCREALALSVWQRRMSSAMTDAQARRLAARDAASANKRVTRVVIARSDLKKLMQGRLTCKRPAATNVKA